MKRLTTKAVSLLLSLALLMSVFAVAGAIGASAEDVNYTITFKTNINAQNEMSFADDYWKVGAWTLSGTWNGTVVNRISITKKIPVVEGAYYTVAFDEDSFYLTSEKSCQVLTRIYKSGISGIADGDSLVSSDNTNTLSSNFIAAADSMELISGETSADTISTSGSKIKIKEGSGAAYMLISIYGRDIWTNTESTAALTTQKNDGFKLRITESFEDTATKLTSTNGSAVTAPEECAVNPGELFIGWRNDTTKEVFPGGYVFERISGDRSFTAVSAKIETQEGASVRWSNTDKKRGLRFETHITGNLPADELKDVFSPANVDTRITKEGSTYPVIVYNYVDGEASDYASVIDNENESTLIYYGSVTEFESAKDYINTNFTAYGTAKVIFADGSNEFFNSMKKSTRNMFDVATAAYNSLNSGSDSSDAYKAGKMQLLQEVYGVTGS